MQTPAHSSSFLEQRNVLGASILLARAAEDLRYRQ